MKISTETGLIVEVDCGTHYMNDREAVKDLVNWYVNNVSLLSDDDLHDVLYNVIRKKADKFEKRYKNDTFDKDPVGFRGKI